MIFNPTAQALPETDCIVNSISITPRSDNWHNISDFAVFGLASKIATREEVVETVGKYCGAPAQVIDLPIIDYYDFYDKKPSETNPPHYGNIKISITISKMDSIYNERMIGFEFKHAGDFTAGRNKYLQASSDWVLLQNLRHSHLRKTQVQLQTQRTELPFELEEGKP